MYRIHPEAGAHRNQEAGEELAQEEVTGVGTQEGRKWEEKQVMKYSKVVTDEDGPGDSEGRHQSFRSQVNGKGNGTHD